jgi:hypothetical protein
MEEFDQTLAESLKDSISQFVKQGVDLSNIDTSGGIGKEEALEFISHLIENIRIYIESKRTIDPTNIINSIDQIKSLYETSNTLHMRNITLLIERGAINSLHLLLDPSEGSSLVLAKTISTLNELSKTSQEARDSFEPGGSVRLSGVLTQAVRQHQWSLVRQSISLSASVSLKTENNKVMLMKAALGLILVGLLASSMADTAPVASVPTPEPSFLTISNATSFPTDTTSFPTDTTSFPTDTTTDTKLLKECCQLLRGLCIHDDLRREMSCAYENGRFFLKQPLLVPSLLSLSGRFASQPSLASAALSAAKNLITTEESVQVMSQHGAMELPRRILSHCLQWAADSNKSLSNLPLPPQPQNHTIIQPISSMTSALARSLAKSTIGLMRNLCADDIRKDRLVADGTLDTLIGIMNNDDMFACDAALMEHAIACLAAMSLRSPSNSQKIVDSGVAVELLVKNMRRHFSHQSLQRQGCLTLRNIAARSPEIRAILLDAGAEQVLRDAGRLQAVVDEAYAALRDLGCEVHYVKVSSDGTIEPMYEQFGRENKKVPLNFNPIYEEASSIEQRVRDEARAPFASSDNDDYDNYDDDLFGHQHQSHEHHENKYGGNNNDCCSGDHSHDHNHDHNHHEE